MQMRFLALLAAVTGSVLLAASAAQALPSIDMIWVQSGSATIDAGTQAASSTVTASIVLTSDSIGVSGIFISIAYDAAELAFVSANEVGFIGLPGAGNSFAPLSAGVTPAGAGLIEGFDQGSLGVGLFAANGPKTLGSITFHVIGGTGTTGENDVVAQLSQMGVDSINTGATVRCDSGDASNCIFVGADITGPVPEPTTAILLIAGIAGLGYASRRSIG